MDQDDPEKRIAELERQLAEARAADSGANQGSQPPPAWTPSPAQPGVGQPVPPTFDWQNPLQAAPPAYSFPSAPPKNQGGRIALILLAVGLPIIILVVVGVVVISAFHHATKTLVPTGPAQYSAGPPPPAAGSRPTATISQHPNGSNPSAAQPTQLLTADGLNGLFAQIRGKFGDTMGYELTVYPDYASLDRADPQNSQHKKSYLYRGGSWSEFGPTEHVGHFDNLVDLGKFDAAAVAARMAGAAGPLNVPNPDSTYLIVQGDNDGSTRIAIYVSGNGDSGYMNVNPDGSVKKLYPQS